MSVYTKSRDLPTYPEPPKKPIYLVRGRYIAVTPLFALPYLPIPNAKRASTCTLSGKEPRTCADPQADAKEPRQLWGSRSGGRVGLGSGCGYSHTKGNDATFYSFDVATARSRITSISTQT